MGFPMELCSIGREAERKLGAGEETRALQARVMSPEMHCFSRNRVG